MNVSVRRAHATEGRSVSTQLAPTSARGLLLTVAEDITSMKMAHDVLVRPLKNQPVTKPSIAEVCIFVNMPWVSTFADIDECKSAENACVGHGCINLLGSYRCECQTGYIFNSISRVCEGKQRFPSLHRNKPHWIPLQAPMSASNSVYKAV